MKHYGKQWKPIPFSLDHFVVVFRTNSFVFEPKPAPGEKQHEDIFNDHGPRLTLRLDYKKMKVISAVAE